MSGLPTIHLTNASSRKLHHGRVFNIMAAPRSWERFDGHVEALTPSLNWLRWVQSGQITPEEYRRRYEAMLSSEHPKSSCHAPGNLRAHAEPRERLAVVVVDDGDTLVCACSRFLASIGRCHRAWAVPFLHAAGWRVVLDGNVVRT